MAEIYIEPKEFKRYALVPAPPKWELQEYIAAYLKEKDDKYLAWFLYTKFDLGLYGTVTAYSYYYPEKRPSSNTDEAYFFEASVYATHNLRKCFFDRVCLENSIVHADDHNDESVEEIEVRFPYNFENGDLLPIAKELRALDSTTRKTDV